MVVGAGASLQAGKLALPAWLSEQSTMDLASVPARLDRDAVSIHRGAPIEAWSAAGAPCVRTSAILTAAFPCRVSPLPGTSARGARAGAETQPARLGRISPPPARAY